MAWIALVAALLIEQLHASPARELVGRGAAAIADAVGSNLNAGRRRHGVYAWLLMVGGGVLLGAIVYALAWWLSRAAALLVDVAVLYFTIGFRQFSHHFGEIQRALSEGDVARARRTLSDWLGAAGDIDATLPQQQEAGEIARRAAETGVLLAHRHVFGVLFWYVVLPGPTGPLLYRLAQFVAGRWNRPAVRGDSTLAPDRFGDFARVAFSWLDWLPARASAASFAVVGDFEGALYCWRQVPAARVAEDGNPLPEPRTVLLAAASGALGVRLMSARESATWFDGTDPDGPGFVEPQPQMLRSAVGLVWRALVLWMLALLVLTLVAWLG